MDTNEQTFTPRIARRRARHDIRGVDYSVSEWGAPDRPPVVLLHGWGDTGSSFQFVVDELPDERYVIAPDWRGFGETRFEAASYWFPDYVADLDALLDRYSPGEPAHLVGHSMGANVAGLFAGIFPERVASFVNIEGFGLPDSDPDNAPANYRRWIEKGRDMQPYRTYPALDELALRVQKRSPRLSLARARFVAALWAERAGDEIVLRADPAHRLPNPVQYRRAEARACWQRITARLLVIKGADSAFFDSAGGPDEINTFAEAPTVVIPDAGHMVHFEQPAALAAAIEDFLGAVV